MQRKREEFETKNNCQKSKIKNPKQKKSVNTNIKMITSSSESEYEMSSSIYADRKSKNKFDNSTNNSEKESIDGNSTEIKHVLNHGMSDTNIQNTLWKS